MTEKVISGGQTGVDQIGLEVARSLGIATGGTAPKGFKTEVGPNPDLAEYGLVESHSDNYPVRTKQNVRDSDGTVIFGDPDVGGTKLTIDTAHQVGKPCLVNPTAFALREWLVKNGIRVLNVAGSRGSKLTPEQSERIRQTLTKLQRYYKGDVITADVYLKLEPNQRSNEKHVGIKYGVPGNDVFADDSSDDWYGLLNNVAAKLQRQLEKRFGNHTNDNRADLDEIDPASLA